MNVPKMVTKLDPLYLNQSRIEMLDQRQLEALCSELIAEVSNLSSRLSALEALNK